MTEEQKQTAALIAKAWTDEDFKARLLAAPAEVLAAEGIKGRSGVELRVVENTDSLRYFVLPAPPAVMSLTDDDIVDRAATLMADQIEFL